MENIKKNTLNKEIDRFEEPSFHRLPKPLPCSYATRGAEEAMFTGRVRSALMMTQMMGYRKVLSNLVCDRCKGIRVYEKTSVLEKIPPSGLQLKKDLPPTKYLV